MGDFRTYDPLAISLTWNGIIFTGFAPDTFVTAERSEDSFTKQVGSHGDVCRIKSNDKSGMVTVVLMQHSPTNDQLSDKLRLDERFGGFQVGPLNIEDDNGTTIIDAESAWIQKPANVEFGNEATTREWVIACAELRMHVGSHLV